jgi:circadian clock protein KaiC
MRGTDFQSGHHDYLIGTGRFDVFPSLIAEDNKTSFQLETVSSELPELDALLGGGLTRGTVTMLLGPSGAGKSSLALQYVMAAARRKEAAAIFAFDETFETFAARAAGLGTDIAPAVESGLLVWEDMKPTRISPGEFTWSVRRHVEDKDVRLVVIDSLNSYLATMPEEQALILHMHELLTYLDYRGITTIVIMSQHGLLGDLQAPIDFSFLSDTIVLLRYFEIAGEVRKAISVVKKRSGLHELSIREYRLTSKGVQVGPVLLDFQGVLAGSPAYTGASEPLTRHPADAR